MRSTREKKAPRIDLIVVLACLCGRPIFEHHFKNPALNPARMNMGHATRPTLSIVPRAMTITR
jgi:hypothetical protein